MKNTFVLLTLTLLSMDTYADIFAKFRNEDGSTKWQYVANFSSSVLILTLLIVTIFLLLSNRRAARSNRELTEMKATLEDRVARRTATLQETTAHLQSREAYITSIVNSMPLMLIGLNKEMEIIQWNNVAETVTGRPIAHVLRKKLWDAYPAIALTPEQVSKVLIDKETTTIKHSQRGQYYFDITLYTLTEHEETGIVILVDDVTKQIKAENKLAARDKMSAMGELASAMAYDINLPLQSIVTTLVNAQNQLTSGAGDNKETLLEPLASAQKSGQQASAIIQNLLELASSHRDIKQIADVSKIMDQSIELAGTLFADYSGLNFNNIQLRRDYAESLPGIPCFAAELQQVFVRLLRNAFHALNTSVKGNSVTPEIHIEISEFYNTLWIKVQHNGKVLTPAEQQDIFLPFYSNHTDTPATPVEQRLSYSYYIITEHHQGQMAVTSDENFGTSFHIQLPLA